MAVAFLVAEHRFYGSWAQQLQLPGSRAQAQQLWHMGLVAARHVREQTSVSLPLSHQGSPTFHKILIEVCNTLCWFNQRVNNLIHMSFIKEL